MFVTIEKVKVTCDACGFSLYVGNDPDYVCIPFSATDAMSAEEAAIETLEKVGWAYNYPDEEIFCPVCTHGVK